MSALRCRYCQALLVQVAPDFQGPMVMLAGAGLWMGCVPCVERKKAEQVRAGLAPHPGLTFVVAVSLEAAEAWATDNLKDRAPWVFVDRPIRLKGLPPGTRVEFVGAWRCRPDADLVLDMLKAPLPPAEPARLLRRGAELVSNLKDPDPWRGLKPNEVRVWADPPWLEKKPGENDERRPMWPGGWPW